MSSRACASSSSQPSWLWEYLQVAEPAEDEIFRLGDHEFVVKDGIPRTNHYGSGPQTQTERVFGFKWNQRDTYDSDQMLKHARSWLLSRYGDFNAWLAEHGERPLLIDAGCGAAMSSIELFGDTTQDMRYFGIDISAAVDVARRRFIERGWTGGFMQADICDLPFPPSSVDLIFAEGSLHHTDSTEHSLKSLAHLLKPGGRFLFYVYRRKGPLREFTDNYIRHRLHEMSPSDAWTALEGLTRLGIALGELDVEVEVPEPVDLLDIPAGRINIQRLFY